VTAAEFEAVSKLQYDGMTSIILTGIRNAA
jgi:hypothetical protein